MQIIDILFTAIVGWFVISFALGYLHNRIAERNEEESEEAINVLSGDWTFPIKIEYNDKQWYAWDNDDTFIMQAESKQILLESILNKFDISPKRLEILSEKALNETQSQKAV